MALGATGCGFSASPTAPTRANVVLVTIDTLRSDRLGRGWTPTLDRLAAEGLRFTAARSTSPLTLPAHTSIMTGEWPPLHGARLNGSVWAAQTPPMARRLKSAGYRTMAVVAAFVLDRRFGLADGFDTYDDQITRAPDAMDRLQAERPGGEVVSRAVAQLASVPTDAPWFLWVHLYDPHAPYAPPAEDLARSGGDPYNGEVSAADRAVGRLMDAVRSRSDDARTAVLVMGDHGESLGEHGEPTHGMLLFDAALRVPVIVRAPGVAPAERRDPVSLVDVLPTVLELAGLDLPAREAFSGRSLLGRPAPDREIYAETNYPTLAGWAPLRALVQDRWKLVRADRPLLYDLGDDPAELRDVAALHANVTTAMNARLDVLGTPSARGSGVTPTASSDVANRLRALGYVAPSAGPISSVSGQVNPADAMPVWAAFETALADVNADRAADAIPALARAHAAYPLSPLFATTYAQALTSAGRSRDALAVLRNAVKRVTSNAALFHELAVAARDAGASTEALRAEDAAIALDPFLPSAYNGKGLLHADAGRPADAQRAFAEAVRLDPTNAAYQGNLGNANRAVGDLAAAAAAYERALALAPNLGDALNGLGVVLVQQNRPREAVPWLERAARDPGFIEAQLNLGIAYQSTGNTEHARAQYRRVLAARGPYSRERDAARALIAQLEKR